MDRVNDRLLERDQSEANKIGKKSKRTEVHVKIYDTDEANKIGKKI